MQSCTDPIAIAPKSDPIVTWFWFLGWCLSLRRDVSALRPAISTSRYREKFERYFGTYEPEFLIGPKFYAPMFKQVKNRSLQYRIAQVSFSQAGPSRPQAKTRPP